VPVELVSLRGRPQSGEKLLLGLSEVVRKGLERCFVLLVCANQFSFLELGREGGFLEELRSLLVRSLVHFQLLLALLNI